MWQRWNQTTHIFEKSDNNGASWTPLGLSADIITEGTINPARLPAQQAFPVGSIFIAAVSTNPSTLLGYGTWTQFAQGRVLVGQNGADVDFDTVEETGGAKTHSHVYTQVPQHTHGVTDPGHAHSLNIYDAVGSGSETGRSSGNLIANPVTNANTTGITIQNAGVVNPSTNTASSLQPYIVVFMWKRTA